MTIKDLKNKIKTIDDSFMIFLYEDNSFLALQYAKEISKIKNLDINYINTLQELQSASQIFFQEFSPTLNIVLVDEFSENVDDYSEFKNCIVVCNKISKELIEATKSFTINFPALLDWQIKDYIKVICKNLDQDKIDWLYSASKGNIYKIINEVTKISIFDMSEQEQVFFDLQNSENTDLFSFDKFYLSNALVSRDIRNIMCFMHYDKALSVKPLGLISALISEFKNILFIKFNSGLKPEQLGISLGKYKFIYNNYNQITEQNIKNILSFLINLDTKIKLGEIDLNNQALSEYIICRVISLYR